MAALAVERVPATSLLPGDVIDVDGESVVVLERRTGPRLVEVDVARRAEPWREWAVFYVRVGMATVVSRGAGQARR